MPFRRLPCEGLRKLLGNLLGGFLHRLCLLDRQFRLLAEEGGLQLEEFGNGLDGRAVRRGATAEFSALVRRASMALMADFGSAGLGGLHGGFHASCWLPRRRSSSWHRRRGTAVRPFRRSRGSQSANLAGSKEEKRKDVVDLRHRYMRSLCLGILSASFVDSYYIDDVYCALQHNCAAHKALTFPAETRLTVCWTLFRPIVINRPLIRQSPKTKGSIMPAVQYPFIDIAVHPRVRERFSRGDAHGAVLGRPLPCAVGERCGSGAVWAMRLSMTCWNRAINHTDITFRQLEATAPLAGRRRKPEDFMIRIAQGFPAHSRRRRRLE